MWRPSPILGSSPHDASTLPNPTRRDPNAPSASAQTASDLPAAATAAAQNPTATDGDKYHVMFDKERDFKPGDVIGMPEQIRTEGNAGTADTGVIIVENGLANGARRVTTPP